MPNFYPSIEKIKSLNPSNSERNLLNLLYSNLDNSYDVYYKPFLNGDEPHIVVLKENGGMFIIEISDLNLSDYKYNCSKTTPCGELYNCTDSAVYNPLQHVYSCKENIFGNYIEELYIDKLKKSYVFDNLVKVGVWFSNSNNELINETFKDIFNDLDNPLHEYMFFWDMNSKKFIIQAIKNILDTDFSNIELYKKFSNILRPKYHSFADGQEYKFTPQQQKLIKSIPNSQAKIKGVAGCGKTLVLVNRAVSAENRTKGKILILTFNITLRNYIKTRLKNVNKDFSWDSFVITHYHDFINNSNLQNHKYDAILIDEGQDFKIEWFREIRKYLADNGEFIIFADEKQNIYNREIDEDKKIVTNIPGKWNVLKSSFRISNTISKLAIKFQQQFFYQKYELDSENEQLELDTKQDIKYEFNTDITYSQIFDKIYNYIEKYNIPHNNICILANKVEYLREIEQYARKKHNLSFERTFETKEQYDEIVKIVENEENYVHISEKQQKRKIKEQSKKLQKIRKLHFNLDCDKIKISTTHSFKGWEIETLILIINAEDFDGNKELIYTALTRCKNNLLIFNKGNTELDNFFSENLE